jgi:hypothetical protein
MKLMFCWLFFIVCLAIIQTVRHTVTIYRRKVELKLTQEQKRLLRRKQCEDRL